MGGKYEAEKNCDCVFLVAPHFVVKTNNWSNMHFN